MTSNSYNQQQPSSKQNATAPSSYTDFSLERKQPGDMLDESFPVKLHYVLADIEKDGKDNIICWHVHGRCFSVRRQPQFVEHIMPFYFRQSKYASFLRQLNLYGFRRITSGPDKGAYYHECFLRGKPFLATRIQRHRIKGTGARKAGVPEEEPDFFSMPFLPSNELCKYPSSVKVTSTSTSTTSATTTNICTSQRPQPTSVVSQQRHSRDRDLLLAEALLNRAARDRKMISILEQAERVASSSTLPQAPPLSAVAALHASASKAARALPSQRPSSLTLPASLAQHNLPSASLLDVSRRHDGAALASSTDRIRQLIHTSNHQLLRGTLPATPSLFQPSSRSPFFPNMNGL